MHAFVTPGAKHLYIPRSNQVLGRNSRYRPAALGKTFPRIVDILASPEMAYIDIDRERSQEGFFGPGARTVIRPGWRTRKRVFEYDLEPEDFGLARDEEVIVLKREKQDLWDKGDWIEYDDTTETERFRAEMETINDWLANADIEIEETTDDPRTQGIDSRDRRLRRIFTHCRFDSGGRLFGGFWQQLKKSVRNDCILIEGEDVATLDYAQMNPRILYGLTGCQPPSEDAYIIPGFEFHRDGIKKVMNAMIFSSKPLQRMPRDTRKHFPRGDSVSCVVDAILAAHPGLAKMFHVGLGHHAQFIESRIMVDLLLRLRDVGIVALPIHDAVIVGRSHQNQTRDIMLKTFTDQTGVAGMVSEE